MEYSLRRSQRTCQVNYLINKYADELMTMSLVSDSGSGGPPQEGCPSYAEKVGITMYWRSKGK